jgi:hypothetical protein
MAPRHQEKQWLKTCASFDVVTPEINYCQQGKKSPILQI